MTKKMIHEHSYSDLEYMTLKDIKKNIDDYIKEYGEKAYLIIRSEYTESVISISYSREETDHEYKQRLEREERFKNDEYKRYLTLKKKFEGE